MYVEGKSRPSCIFCDIVAHREPASIIHEDEAMMAFMGIQPTAPGECLLIPKVHIDHFTDIPDALAQHIIAIAQQIGRTLRHEFTPARVGYLVHGYGVAHAHLVLVPQHGPFHLTSDRFARIENGVVVFDLSAIPMAERSVLDLQARVLAAGITHQDPK